MLTIKKSLVAVSLFAAAGFAAATPFSVSAVTFTPGAGYGVDGTETTSSPTTLLDVRFSTAAFRAQNFNLDKVGDAFSFAVGTVHFAEPNAAQGIIESERDQLGVTVSFNFTRPGNAAPVVFTTATATAGSISDNALDYALNWAPVTVNFGSTGQYLISLSNLAFTNIGTKTEMATITLLQADTARAGVPEPGSLALFGLGMLALGGLRRRKRAT